MNKSGIKILAVLLFILAVSLCLITTADAEETDTKYEVTISVTYNAVSIGEANAIVADAMERHKTACKSEVKAKKVDGNNGYLTINYDSDITLVTDGVTTLTDTYLNYGATTEDQTSMDLGKE